jgi:hypothetical protein
MRASKSWEFMLLEKCIKINMVTKFNYDSCWPLNTDGSTALIFPTVTNPGVEVRS